MKVMIKYTGYTILVSVITTLVTVGVVGAVFLPMEVHRTPSKFSPETMNETSAGTTTNGQIARESEVVQAVQKSSRAVVSVIATKKVPVLERFYERDPRLFGLPVPHYRREGSKRREIGGGSGFFVSADGLVVTNRHVVADKGAQYSVLMKDGSKKKAEVVARDPVLDIAVLDVDGSGYPALSFADSETLKPGQTVIAIGNALGEFTNSVSTGVISGLSRSITAGGMQGRPETLRGVIQTDAAINPGNSGGPLLNLNGNVVGVNVAMAQGSENIGFALPSNEVASIVESVKKTGEIGRPFLGVRYVPVSEQVEERFDLAVDHGALLIGGPRQGLAVVPDSPAADIGLREGDIITKVEGQNITKDKPLARRIRDFSVGETVMLTVYRDGSRITKQVTLAQTPSSESE